MPHLRWAAALFFGCAAAPSARPPIDESAMREAIESSQAPEEPHASSASYAHYLRARIAHLSGEHRRALDELRLALATDPGNPLLVTSLAEEYARLSELDRAERELMVLLEHHPNYQPAQLMMGKVEYEAHKPALAASHLRRAIRLTPLDPEAYLVLAQVQLDEGAPDEAVKTIEALGAAAPGEPTGYRRLGLVLAEKGDYSRAEKLLSKAVEIDRADAESWVALAHLFELTGRPKKAEDAYDQALVEDPDNRDVLIAAGRLALSRNMPSRARAYFDRVVSLSDDPSLGARVALAYLASHQFASAAEFLDGARAAGLREAHVSFYAGLVHERLLHYSKAAEAYAEVPSEAEMFQDAQLRRASCLSMAGDHVASLSLFQKALAEQPDQPLLTAGYSRALERSGAKREAENILTSAIERHSSPELIAALAELYHRNGRSRQAVGLLSEALAKTPEDQTLLYALGAAYERSGDFEQSIAQMRLLLKVNPEHAAAMNFIGYSLAEKSRDLDEAERLVKRALELEPESGSFLDSLGWVYFRRGQYKRAVEALERAAELDPEEPLIIEHLGDAYHRTGKKVQAAQAYRRALKALIAVPELQEQKGQRQGLERKLKMLSSASSRR